MQERPLTAGEIALARSVFGEAIDYAKVRLVRGRYWPLHPRNAAMAPDGKIYFHPEAGGWSDDFASEPLLRQGFFIHELTHVWQAQRGGKFYLPLMRHPFCRYGYTLVAGRPFRRYGLEQQAEIVRHLFLARRGYPLERGVDPNALATLVPWTGAGGATFADEAHSARTVADQPHSTGGDSRAQINTDLAEDRTVLANERTFASWLRTAFAAIGIGLAFNALFTRVEPPWVPKAIATGFLAIAIIIFVLAERRMCNVMQRLHSHQVPSLGGTRARLISYLAIAATLLLIAVLWLLPIEPLR